MHDFRVLVRRDARLKHLHARSHLSATAASELGLSSRIEPDDEGQAKVKTELQAFHASPVCCLLTKFRASSECRGSQAVTPTYSAGPSTRQCTPRPSDAVR